jgi:predicted NAD/FAD-binding protein
MNKNGLNIAVVGAGVAGLAAAYLLARRHRVTIFEKNNYAGGHTHTIVLDKGADAGTPIDTGFIVMNDRNYPLLTKLFAQLGVSLRNSDMSFGYHCEQTGLQYAGSDLNSLFAQRRNLCDPRFWGMIRDLLRFYKSARNDLHGQRLSDITMGAYLRRGGYGAFFVQHHLLPMGSAIWSTSKTKMLEFPAAAFVRFFENHGLLALKDRPQWKTVVGGSHTYVQRLLKDFSGPVRLNAAIHSIRRDGSGVRLTPAAGPTESFDRVVIGAHADEAFRMLADPSADERRLLGAWTYEHNKTVLHSDATVMPPCHRAWASWNYVTEQVGGERMPASVTYDMNRLQGLQTAERYFVTLNRQKPMASEKIIRHLDYAHPAFTTAAMATQQELGKLNGVRNTFFCGSYFGYGFHEDAVRSGLAVASLLGETL